MSLLDKCYFKASVPLRLRLGIILVPISILISTLTLCAHISILDALDDIQKLHNLFKLEEFIQVGLNGIRVLKGLGFKVFCGIFSVPHNTVMNVIM